MHRLQTNRTLSLKRGQIVDETNATIVQVAFDSQHIAVRVNVSALDRMILYDRTTGDRWFGFDLFFR